LICFNAEKLIAHHLNSYHWDVENRLNVDNGVCLCENCHSKFHELYGQKYNTKEQYKEYFKNQTEAKYYDFSDWIP